MWFTLRFVHVAQILKVHGMIHLQLYADTSYFPVWCNSLTYTQIVLLWPSKWSSEIDWQVRERKRERDRVSECKDNEKVKAAVEWMEVQAERLQEVWVSASLHALDKRSCLSVTVFGCQICHCRIIPEGDKVPFNGLQWLDSGVFMFERPNEKDPHLYQYSTNTDAWSVKFNAEHESKLLK